MQRSEEHFQDCCDNRLPCYSSTSSMERSSEQRWRRFQSIKGKHETIVGYTRPPAPRRHLVESPSVPLLYVKMEKTLSTGGEINATPRRAAFSVSQTDGFDSFHAVRTPAKSNSALSECNVTAAQGWCRSSNLVEVDNHLCIQLLNSRTC